MTYTPKVWDKIVYFTVWNRKYLTCESIETIVRVNWKEIIKINWKYNVDCVRPAIDYEIENFYKKKKKFPDTLEDICIPQWPWRTWEQINTSFPEETHRPKEIILRPKQITEIKEKL